jgi:hypothetical protein
LRLLHFAFPVCLLTVGSVRFSWGLNSLFVFVYSVHQSVSISSSFGRDMQFEERVQVPDLGFGDIFPTPSVTGRARDFEHTHTHTLHRREQTPLLVRHPCKDEVLQLGGRRCRRCIRGTLAHTCLDPATVTTMHASLSRVPQLAALARCGARAFRVFLFSLCSTQGCCHCMCGEPATAGVAAAARSFDPLSFSRSAACGPRAHTVARAPSLLPNGL